MHGLSRVHPSLCSPAKGYREPGMSTCGNQPTYTSTTNSPFSQIFHPHSRVQEERRHDRSSRRTRDGRDRSASPEVRESMHGLSRLHPSLCSPAKDHREPGISTCRNQPTYTSTTNSPFSQLFHPHSRVQEERRHDRSSRRRDGRDRSASPVKPAHHGAHRANCRLLGR